VQFLSDPADAAPRGNNSFRPLRNRWRYARVVSRLNPLPRPWPLWWHERPVKLETLPPCRSTRGQPGWQVAKFPAACRASLPRGKFGWSIRPCCRPVAELSSGMRLMRWEEQRWTQWATCISKVLGKDSTLKLSARCKCGRTEELCGRHTLSRRQGRPDGRGIPGIIVLDLATGRARGVLDHEKSTMGSSPISVDGVMMRGPDGQPLILHDPQISLWTDAHIIGANESCLNRFARMPGIPLRARRGFPTPA
jgi:hypothetical protein